MSPPSACSADDDPLFLDAVEASRRIRPDAPDAAVIVLTGSSHAEDVEKAYDAGAAGHVTKDRLAQDLVRTVLSAVRRILSLS